MGRGNKDHNCFWNNLHCESSRREHYQIPPEKRTVCFGSNNRGLSFEPYKQVVAVKLMNNYSNNKPHDPHGFKEEVNIKHDTVKAVIRKFPNGKGVMIKLLEATVPSLDWVEYCAMPLVDQLV